MLRRSKRVSKADRAVYAAVTERDYGCRACGAHGTTHRHHLLGRKVTTVQSVAVVCNRCHNWLHVRLGGKKLKLHGRADVVGGLTAEWRQLDDTWRVVPGR